MNYNNKVNKANVIPIEVLKHQLQIANGDGFDCIQVKTSNKNMMCYYGATYPKATTANGSIYMLWINVMKPIHAIDSERDDLEGF